MTRKRPSRAEKLAEDLYNDVGLPVFEHEQKAKIVPWSRVDARLRPVWLALARHVLRRERAARGRTEGYVAVVHQFGGHPALLLSPDCTTRENAESQARAEDGDVARVVLVPKRRRS